MTKPTPAQLRVMADKAVRHDLQGTPSSERAQACRVMIRAWTVALFHEEGAEAAAETSYRLGDEMVGGVR
jgi:hypothetical protein